MTALQVEKVVVGYGPSDEVLKGVDLTVEDGEIVTIIGPNGAGKSTLLKTIAGLLKPKSGSIRHDGVDITGWSPRDVTASGIAFVPQEKNVFGSLTVYENLEMAAYLLKRDAASRIAGVLGRFPEIAPRRRALAQTLSGGQRQMLAMAMALVPGPRLLLLDEPSAGLSPRAAGTLFATIRSIGDEGIAIAIVEQAALASLEIADRGYILAEGKNAATGKASDLRADKDIGRLFLGL